MFIIKLILILLLIYVFICNNKESFKSSELIKKSKEVLKKKDLFKPGVGYGKIKKHIKWVDPVIYDDIYKLSLKEPLTIFNLEKTLSNNITE